MFARTIHPNPRLHLYTSCRPLIWKCAPSRRLPNRYKRHKTHASVQRNPPLLWSQKPPGSTRRHFNDEANTLSPEQKTYNVEESEHNLELMEHNLDVGAEKIFEADCILVCAGAGMGVDSGLPDFRDLEGFWEAYPSMKEYGFNFLDAASPCWFHYDAEFAWGFYGKRLSTYRNTTPHFGFQILHNWMGNSMDSSFVYTCNVDGQFQKAGYSDDKIVEVFGNINYLQCSLPCHPGIWPADQVNLVVKDDQAEMSSIPQCIHKCGNVARPNVRMYGPDQMYQDQRMRCQIRNYNSWLHDVKKKGKRLVIVECGATSSAFTGGDTVRSISEEILRTYSHSSLIRINQKESAIEARLMRSLRARGQSEVDRAVGIPLSPLTALTKLDTRIRASYSPY